MFAIVFDTETTDLNKCFCYDVGYLIFNMDDGHIIEQKHFVVEQIWHNLELFQTAYYAEKRPLYVNLMRSKKATLEKWGYIMRELRQDIKKYGITDGYAYNVNFDDKVFQFNCDWFKTLNPLDTLALHDIWGYVSETITNQTEYQEFCEKNLRFTDSGNYSGTAETVYQFIKNSPAFVEQHMGLYDAQIEYEILKYCINDKKLIWNMDYKVIKILTRTVPHPYTIKVNGSLIHSGNYVKKSVYKDEYRFTEA